MLAQLVLKTARTVHVFHMQSIHIARQALNLVVRLNEAVDEDGLDDDELDEKIRLMRFVKVTLVITTYKTIH
jgi:hypothetical protein